HRIGEPDMEDRDADEPHQHKRDKGKRFREAPEPAAHRRDGHQYGGRNEKPQKSEGQRWDFMDSGLRGDERAPPHDHDDDDAGERPGAARDHRISHVLIRGLVVEDGSRSYRRRTAAPRASPTSASDMKFARRLRSRSRARCARVFADASVMPSDTATSAIRTPSTSCRRMMAR